MERVALAERLIAAWLVAGCFDYAVEAHVFPKSQTVIVLLTGSGESWARQDRDVLAMLRDREAMWRTIGVRCEYRFLADDAFRGPTGSLAF